MMKERSSQPRITESINKRLLELMQKERFQGSPSAFVRGILLRFLDGLLVDRKDAEAEIREQIYAELAAEGLIIPEEQKNERNRKTG